MDGNNFLFKKSTWLSHLPFCDQNVLSNIQITNHIEFYANDDLQRKKFV